MIRKFAISDIHGCLKSFKALLVQIDLGFEDHLYILGDMTDRGPDSKGVIDYIWQLQSRGYQVFCIQGNHDLMMVEATKKLTANIDWIRHGGKATLNSFNVGRAADLPGKYINFLADLPRFFVVDQYVLVHAGLNFKQLNPMEDEMSMLWIRNWYKSVNYKWLGDRYIVHGHTPLRKTDIEALHAQFENKRVLDIDGGCFFDIEGMGYLVAFELGTHQLYWQSSLDGNRSNPI